MTREEEQDKKAEEQKKISEAIIQAYNVDHPDFAFICGGLRKIAVNPEDRRVQKKLLRKGIKYFTSIQTVIYLCIKCLPVDVFLDIGSNYGECVFALPLYQNVKVRGYEANAELHKYLNKSKLYNDDIKDIKFAWLAVSNRAGEKLSFYIDTDWSGKSSVLPAEKKSSLVKILVPTTSIDHEMYRIGPCNLLLVKIDVEGFEPVVMDGAAETNRVTPNIIYIVEFNSRYLLRGNVKPNTFFNKLTELFHRVYVLSNRDLRPVESFDQLQAQLADASELYVDLVLIRFEDSKLARAFEKKIATQDLEKIKVELV